VARAHGLKKPTWHYYNGWVVVVKCEMNGLGQLVTVPWKQQQRRTELSRDSKKDKV